MEIEIIFSPTGIQLVLEYQSQFRRRRLLPRLVGTNETRDDLNGLYTQVTNLFNLRARSEDAS